MSFYFDLNFQKLPKITKKLMSRIPTPTPAYLAVKSTRFQFVSTRFYTILHDSYYLPAMEINSISCNKFPIQYIESSFDEIHLSAVCVYVFACVCCAILVCVRVCLCQLPDKG